MKFSDKEIIAHLQRGDDDEVLKYLYRTQWPKILNYISKNSGTSEEAQDIFQDCIVAFYKQVKLNKFDANRDIGGFLYTISRNLWINKVKKQQRQLPLADDADVVNEDENILSSIISSERAALVMEVFSKLGERCQLLLTYSIFNQFSMREICEKMGFSSENGAKTRNYKCKQQLIKLVESNGGLKKSLQE